MKTSDRWGKPYKLQFGVSNTKFTVSVSIGGSDGRFDTNHDYPSSDFTIWTSKIDYFTETGAKADDARAWGAFGCDRSDQWSSR
ncbi:MAG TPA: hypothetical protein VF762_04740 [Blastocatellia bacterium]